MPAIALADGQRLAVHFKGFADPARGKDREGLLLLVGQAFPLSYVRQPFLLPIDLLEECPAVIELADIDARIKTQGIHAKVRSIRIAADLPRVVTRPKKAGVLARPGKRSFH